MTNLPLQVVLHTLRSRKTLIPLLFLVFLLALCFQGFFSSKERLKERKTDTEELIGKSSNPTQSHWTKRFKAKGRFAADFPHISASCNCSGSSAGPLAGPLGHSIQYFYGHKALKRGATPPEESRCWHVTSVAPCPRTSQDLLGTAENTGRMTLVNGGHL